MSSDRLEQLRDMLREEPGDPFLRYAIALELNRAAATEQAINDLEQLLRDMPGHIASYYQLAMMLAELGRTQDAMHCCEAGMLQCLVAGDRKARTELAALRENLEDEMP